MIRPQQAIPSPFAAARVWLGIAVIPTVAIAGMQYGTGWSAFGVAAVSMLAVLVNLDAMRARGDLAARADSGAVRYRTTGNEPR